MSRSIRSLAAEVGQGTVEYVALVLLVAGIFTAVVAAGNGFKGDEMVKKITGQIQTAIGDLK